MRMLAIAALLASGAAAPALAQEPTPRVAPEDMRWVAPDLAGFTDEVLFGQVWRGRDLNPRDRSLVTISALIAGGHTAQLAGHLNRALDNGVTPAEIGGVVTHLAFYTGWPNAVSSLGVTRKVLEARGVTAEDMQAPAEASADADRLRVVREGAGSVTEGSADRFRGAVQVSGPFSGSAGSRVGGATVKFVAGARTAWHRRALGQTLVIIEGCGWVQIGGGPVEKICAGDVATTAPGVKHWHGATSTNAMTHVAVSESDQVEWLEQVSDADYARGPR